MKVNGKVNDNKSQIDGRIERLWSGFFMISCKKKYF